MNRRLLVLLGGVAVVAVVAVVYLNRPATEPPVAAPVEAPRTAPRPAAPVVAPAPAPRPSAPSARRAEPEAAAPEPAPAAEPSAAAPTAAMLRIEADVPGAQVFIDRTFVGEAPVTTTDFAPGSHTLNVSAKGYESIGRTIEVAAGPSEIVVKFREVRLNATLAVVHKHRMGSCSGRLIATPQGMRYETADKDDAFTTSLMDLETFEVDYMAKNLRVKPSKGKRYDFTDPEGNADRLFVFHRDVEKAREQLKRGDAPASQ